MGMVKWPIKQSNRDRAAAAFCTLFGFSFNKSNQILYDIGVFVVEKTAEMVGGLPETASQDMQDHAYAMCACEIAEFIKDLPELVGSDSAKLSDGTEN